MIKGELKEAVAAMEVEFMADAEAMIFDGFDTDAQDVGNFFAGAIFGDEFENAALGGSEFINLRFAEQQGLNAIAAALASMRQ